MQRRRARAAVLALFSAALCGGLVIARTQAVTTTHLTISAAAAVLGQPVTLTATVSPAPDAGSVTFYDGATIIGVGPIASGTASITTPLLSAGGHSLWAAFTGNGTHVVSVSQIVLHTVTAKAGRGFRPPAAVATPLPAADLVVADFNADGFADVAAALPLLPTSQGYERGKIDVLLGAGDGTLHRSATITLTDAAAVAAADFDSDGRTDLVAADGGTPSVVVLRGNGDGTFASPMQHFVGINPSIVVVGDFNADGRSDIAGMRANVGSVLLLGNGDGNFQPPVVFSTGAQPFAVAVGDVDGDGINDLVVAGDGPENGDLFLVRGAGAGAFQPPVRLSETANGIRGLAIGDVNGDGRPDVIAGNTLTDTVDVFVASATGVSPPASFLAATPGSIALADVNGDGHLDVITASSSLSGVNVLPGLGDGTFEPFRNDGSGANPKFVAAAEFNGDGVADLVVSSHIESTVAVLAGISIDDVFLSATPMSAPAPATASLIATLPADAQGTVTFYNGTTTLGTVNVSAGAAALTTGPLPRGHHTIRAVHSGDAIRGVSEASVVITRTGSSVVRLVASRNPSSAFDDVTFVATVEQASGAAAIPTGTVTFTRTEAAGPGDIVTVPLVNGTATFVKSRLRRGIHQLSAQFDGDALFMPSASKVLTHVVSDTPICTVTSSPNPARTGEEVLITAECAGADPQVAVGNTPVTVSLSALGNGFVRGTTSMVLVPGFHIISVTPGIDQRTFQIVGGPRTVTITNLNDSGPGSLRWAIGEAARGDVVIFSPGTTGGAVHLVTPVVIDKPLTLMGPGSNTEAIDGAHLTRLLIIKSGGVTVSGLTLRNGTARGGNGGTGFAGGGGAAGLGGAVYVDTDDSAPIQFQDVRFEGNRAMGGRGGNGMFLTKATALLTINGGGAGVDGHNGQDNVGPMGGWGGDGGSFGGVGGRIFSGPIGADGTDGGLGAGGGGSITPGLGGYGGFAGGGGGGVGYGGQFGGGGGGATSSSAVGGGGGEWAGSGGATHMSRDCPGGIILLCGPTEYWGGAGGGGGAGLGGALFIYRGIVVVTNTSFFDNAASGGDAGTTASTPYTIFSSGQAPERGRGMGGGYYVQAPGTLLMKGNVFPSFGGNFAQDPGVGRPDDFEGAFDNTNGYGSLSTYIPTGASARGPLRQTAVAGSVFSSPLAIDIHWLPGSGPHPVEVTFELFSGTTFVDGSRVARVTDIFTATSPFIRAGAEPGTYGAVARWSNHTVTFAFTVTPSIPLTTTITAAPGQRPGSSTTLRADLSWDVVGPVGFLDGARFVGSAPLQDRAALLTTRALRPGLHGLRAVYSGNLETPPNSSETLWRQVTNRQSASFAVASSFGGSLSSLAAGELHPDRIDLVGMAEDGIHILRQDAAGGYSAPEVVLTGDPPTSFGMADFNGDGRRDLAVLTTNLSTAESRLRLFMQHATWVQTESFLLDPGTRTLAIGDINVDGQPDIAVIGIAPRVQMWFGLASTTGQRWYDMKTPLFNAEGGLVFDDIVIDDFSGDGIPDLAVTNRQAGRVHLLMRNHNGEFLIQTPFGVYGQPTSAAAGDINGDGVMDLVVGSSVSGMPQVMYGHVGIEHLSGGLVASAVSGAVSAVAIADFDGDGREDIAATDASAGTVTLFEVPPQNSVNLESFATYTIAGARGIVAADFDDDGRTDLAVANPDDGVLSILRGQPGTAAVTWPFPNAIAPGTALSGAQLNATASQFGSFRYSPPAGTILPAGQHTLSVTLTPQDDGIPPVTASTQIWVQVPTVIWQPSPSSIDPETPLSAGQLNASASANGTFTYTQTVGEFPPMASLIPEPPLDWILTAHFEPFDRLFWAPIDVSVALTVHRRVPVITWDPAPIPFGFPIGPRLNATADIPGSFSYTPFEEFVPPHSGPLNVTAAFFPEHPLPHAMAHKTVVLEILAVPTTIDLQPMSSAFCDGHPAQLSVSATATSLVYQWRRNGQPIQVDGALLSGVHTPTLSFSTPLDGIYDVLVNETASNPATVTIAYPPEVGIMAPSTTRAGQVLFINGSRTGPDLEKTTLQWQFSVDGTTWIDLAGATSEDLEIPNASTALNGFYRLVGTTACGTATTPAVHASVERIEHFILGPFLDVQGPLTYGQTAVLIGQASSGLPVSYTVLNGSVTVVDGHIRATGVGPFQIKITQDGDDLRYLPATAEIYDGSVEKAVLTAQLQPARRRYGAANPEPQFMFIGLANGDTPAVVSGVTTFTEPPADHPAGTAGAQITRVLTAPNYLIEYDTSAAQMLIDRAPLTIQLHDLTKIYGQPTPPITFEYVGLVLGETTPSLASGLDLIRGWPQSPNGDATLPAATYPISASQESTNYEITVDDGTLTVSPAPLTITADDKSRAFGAPNPPFTASYSAFVNGESPATALTGALAFSTNATETSPAGAYVITPSGVTAANYALTFAPGALTIVERAVTIGVANASRRYGDPNPVFEPIFMIGGVPAAVDMTTLGGSFTVTTTATPDSIVGAYTLTPGGFTSSYYSISYAPGTLTIDPAPLGVTVADSTRKYGAPNPSFAAVYTGFKLNQSATVLEGTLTFTAPAANAAIGSHPVTPAGLTSSNYALSFAPGPIAITPAPLTMRPEARSRYYGAATPSFTIEYVGLAGGDTADSIGGTVTTTATESSVPGDYPLVVSGGNTGNYDVTRLDGTLRIDKAILTVDIGVASRLYGDDNSTITYTTTYSPFVLGQGASILEGTLQLSTPAMPRSEGGIYPVTLSGLSSALYDIIFIEGQLRIDARPLIVSAPDMTRVYGQLRIAPSAAQLTYSGFLPGDGPQMLQGTVEFLENDTEFSDADSYPTTPIGLSGWPNYQVIPKAFRIIVHRAPLVVRANDVTINFGEAAPAFSVSYEGFVFGQDASVVTGAPSFTPNHNQFFQAGQYAITPFNSGNSQQARNYVFQYVAGTLTVKSLPLVIAAVDAARLYGHANPSFTITYSGLRPDDHVQSLQQGVLAFTTPATESSSVGEYPVTPSGVTVRNYDVEFAAGTLTVTPSPLTVRATGQVRRYGIDNKPYGVSYTGFLAGDGPAALGGELAFDAPGAEAPVGTHQIVPSGLTSSNYTIAFQPGPLLVQRAILDVTPNDATRKFGMPNPPFTIHYDGFKNGEGPEVLQGLVVQTSASELSPVGQYEILASGLSSANYEFDYTPGHLTVERATLTVTADNSSRMYAGFWNPAALTVTYSGLVPGTESTVSGTVSFTTSATSHSPVGDYDLVPAGLFSTTYDVVYVPGTLTITPAPLTLLVNNASRIYGAPNPAFTGLVAGFVNGETESIVQGTPTFTTAADQFSPVGTYDIVASASGLTAPNYFFVPASEPGRLTITKATPQVSWTNPPDIRYPAPLGANELNATASVPGSFVYTAALGDILRPGCWIQSAAFTPDDTVNYASASAGAFICVLRGQQHITWATPPAIDYGVPLDATRLNASVSGDGPEPGGALSYQPPAGSKLEGGERTLQVSAPLTPFYEAATATVTLTVLPVDQVITWNTPAPITYGTPLTNVQKNATVSVVGPAPAGQLTYTPSTLVPAGLQTLTVTAAATNNYNTATASVQIQVAKLPVILSSMNGGGFRSFYDPPTVTWFDLTLGLPFSVGMTSHLPIGTPAGSYRPVFVLDDPLGLAVNYELTTFELFYISNPPVSVIALDRLTAVKGSGPVDITITGDGFVPSCGQSCPPPDCESCFVDTLGTYVQWNDTMLPVRFVSRNEVVATVPANLLAATGVAYISIAGAVTKEFFITNAPTTIESAATGSAWGDPFHLDTGAIGEGPPALQVDTTAGEGTVTIATYTGNPGGALAGGGHFFDVYVAPGSTFQELTITTCALTDPTSQISWFNGTTWIPASHQVPIAGTPACVRVTVTGQTSPTIAQLSGTFFAAVGLTVAPTITMAPDRTSLWPPNGALVPVVVRGRTTGTVAAATYRVIDEYAQAQPAGAITLAADGSYSFTVMLPASRLGSDKDGRAFTIRVSAVDRLGNGGAAAAMIRVPHDQGKK